MDISIHAKVNCIDGHGGTVSHVILNPFTNTITHIVVHRGIMEEERVVPVDMIVESTPDRILLSCTRDELHHLQPFVYDEYVKKEIPEYSDIPGEALYAPLVMEEITVPVKQEFLPPDELAIQRGARVIALDGPIGQVDEFVVDPVNNRISDLVLREGHFWGQRDVTIPVNQIHRVEDDQVFLKIDRQAVVASPSIPVKRRRL